MNSSNITSPLWLDILDLEQEVRMLYSTNEELRTFVSTDESMLEVIEENVQAIKVKLRKRQELRASLGFPDDDDDDAWEPQKFVQANEWKQPPVVSSNPIAQHPPSRIQEEEQQQQEEGVFL